MNEIQNQDYKLTSEDLTTFRGMPQRKVWPLMDPLYRLLTPGNNGVLGKFWFSRQAFHAIIRQTNTGPGFQAIARARLAVQPQWNPKLSYMCKIMLTKEAFVWVGPAKYQPLSEADSNVLLMGNLEQVFIPHLADGSLIPGHFAQIRYYGSVQDI